MSPSDVSHPATLDIHTLVFAAVVIATLLGAFMVLSWLQDRSSRALAWWGAAYLIGGAAVVTWAAPQPLLPVSPALASALMFIACGMIWNGVRLFQGRAPLWPPVFAGAVLWLALMQLPGFAASEHLRSSVGGIFVALYTFCIAVELWRERRGGLFSRTAALIVPLLHAAIFLVPIFMKEIQTDDMSDGWMTVFALETMLYAVGVAFMVLLMVKDRTVFFYRNAASTDSLTGLLNRRAFHESASLLFLRQRRRRAPITVLAFDLDRFKSVNDTYGHATGDDVLRAFAASVRASMRAEDIIARLGGEEFVALVPVGVEIAGRIAERVRAGFERDGQVVGQQAVGATVSIGCCCALAADASVEMLLERADAALYRAKHNGRNRVEFAESVPADASQTIATERALNRLFGIYRRRTFAGLTSLRHTLSR